jgi:hypothetical protein
MNQAAALFNSSSLFLDFSNTFFPWARYEKGIVDAATVSASKQ